MSLAGIASLQNAGGRDVVDEPRTSDVALRERMSVEIACLIHSPGLCIVVSSSFGGRLKIIRKNLSAESASCETRQRTEWKQIRLERGRERLGMF